MHIRTNVEMSFIHVVVLAICPLMLIMTTASQALYFIAATIVCFLLSSLVCLMFNKYLSHSVKIFITAVLSAFLVTIFNYAVEEYGILNLTVSEESFFVVVTTIVLSIDVVYIETKARTEYFILKLFKISFVKCNPAVGAATEPDFLAKTV